MAYYSSFVQNATVKNDENVDKFPYRILNDLSKKLKVAEATIASLLAECELNRSNQKLLGDVGNLAVKAVPHEALEDAKDDEIKNLKRRISELTYENNRYHLTLSNCTFCVSDDANTSDTSIRASTPESCPLPSSDPDPASSASTIPALMSLTTEDRRQVEANTVVKFKDRNFISRMVRTLTKLETKYQIPEHKRKKRLFSRKSKPGSIVPKELATIYNALAAPEPDVIVPDPFPQVRWNDVRFKPGLPNPEPCPIQSCSPDPVFYVDRDSPSFRCNFNFAYVASQNGRPFGALPGYATSLGVVAVPTTPVGGYVYCPDAKKWVLYAEPHSAPSAGRGTRTGGTPPARRRRG